MTRELERNLSKMKNDINMFISTVLKCRRKLGWTCRGSAYSQLIRETNKAKRLEWAKKYIDDDLSNVIFTDECSVQLEAHRRRACRRIGNPPKPKPRYVYS